MRLSDIAVRARTLVTRPRFAVIVLAALAAVTAFSAPAPALAARQAAGPHAAAVRTTGVRTTGVRTTGVRTTGVHTKVVMPNGLAATPPMGWNDWYSFGCDVNASLIEQTAKAMVTSGMKAAGYEYVNIDDCWLDSQRAADGSLQADPAKFPDGIKAVADYVHSLGLKLGIYEDVGTETCAGYPGTFGHYAQDARTLASWGVDFVKMDWCNVPFGDFPGLTEQQVAEKLYTEFGAALRATGRPILYSICEWDPSLQPWTWAPKIANMWRTNNDYGDTWSQVLGNLDQEASLSSYAGPGHWNDPDILQIGRSGLTTPEDQAQFSMWSMLSAPLLAGNDLRSMTPAIRSILTNRAVIAIDQDPLGAEATRLSEQGNADVWVKRLANGDRAIMLLNRGSTPLSISITARVAGLPAAGAYRVQNLWTHTMSESAGVIASSVPPMSAALFRVTPLRAATASVPPLTDVAVSVPTVYPGSAYQIAGAGQTISVPADFRNDGETAVTGARFTLNAPAGWGLSGTTLSAPVLRSGGELSGTWQVTVPVRTPPGSYTLTADASYRWSGGHASRASGDGGLLVEVPPSGSPYLDTLTWLSASNGYGPVLIDKNYYGGPLTIHGVTYAHGLWTNSPADLTYYLGANCSAFTADLGLDGSDAGQGAVDYQIYADGTKVFDSGVVTNSTPTVHANVSVTGDQILEIVVAEGNGTPTYGNADIAAPQLTCAS
jgi:alpha-galactosidase